MKASFFALAIVVLFLAVPSRAHAALAMQLDRGEIHEGETAMLTVTASGNEGDSIAPPLVPCLEFTAVNQSSQFEMINGTTTSTSSVTYEVTPQGPGTYTIPAHDPSDKPLTLVVLPGSAPSSSLPAPALNGAAPVAPASSKNEAAFVRLELPKNQLYVGETVPAKIEVGLPAGTQPTLDGLPTLTADAFTLEKLSDKPSQTQALIHGEPYTILTWNSSVTAIKPGDFPLAVTTPVTILVRQALHLPGAGEDGFPFDDSFFQNFISTVAQKELNLTSTAQTIHVLALPAQGQTPDSHGAVGRFEVSSSLTPSHASVGDPMTLRFVVKGSGNFDRVNPAMLGPLSDWKAYPPTAKFTPSDRGGLSGEKSFEQAVIPLQAGRQTLPALSFSFFNPDTHHYETVKSDPITVDISPGTSQPAAAPAPALASTELPPSSDGLLPDEIVTGTPVRTLKPLLLQPLFLLGQAIVALTFIGAGFSIRRRKRLAADLNRIKRQQDSKVVESCLAQMENAAMRQDASLFFLSARQALQYSLAGRWNMAPNAITTAEIDGHLNGNGKEIRTIFTLADQLAYSGASSVETDFDSWKKTVRELVKKTPTL